GVDRRDRGQLHHLDQGGRHPAQQQVLDRRDLLPGAQEPLVRWTDAAGLVGVLLILVAYAGAALGRLDPKRVASLLANLVGSCRPSPGTPRRCARPPPVQWRANARRRVHRRSPGWGRRSALVRGWWS